MFYQSECKYVTLLTHDRELSLKLTMKLVALLCAPVVPSRLIALPLESACHNI